MAEAAQRPAGREGAGEPELAMPSDRLMSADSVFLPTISVVVPTMGTPDQLAGSVAGVVEVLEEYQVTGEVIVCLPESDPRAATAREMGAIVVSPERPGYGVALRAGFDQVRGSYVAIGDATGAYDFRELPALFEQLEQGADIVIGSRVTGELEPGAMSGAKRYLSMPLLSGFLNVFYGAGVSDPDSGLRGLRYEVMDAVMPRADGRAAAYRMVLDAADEGLRVSEVPVTYRRRDGAAAGESTGWDYLQFAIENAPADVFTVPGVAMGVMGAVLMGASLLEVDLMVGSQRLFFGNRTMLAGGLLTLVGHQAASVGAFAAVTSGGDRSTWNELTRRLGLRNARRTLTLALAVFAFGALYSAWLLVGMAGAGGLPRQDFTTDLLAMTAILLGTQMAVGTVLIRSKLEA